VFLLIPKDIYNWNLLLEIVIELEKIRLKIIIIKILFSLLIKAKILAIEINFLFIIALIIK
jgi:hypothetical protein